MEVGSPTEIEKSILKHTGPLHANYATVEARIRTFKEWPPALPQRPRELAEAGFYYIGLSDQVSRNTIYRVLLGWPAKKFI